MEAVARDSRMRAPEPDGDVLALCASGEVRAAVGRLMQRHGDAVYRYCSRQLRDATLAEDAYQQVFIAVYRDLCRFEGRSTVRTWVFAIARHRVRGAAKARARRERSVVELAKVGDLHDPRPSPLESLEQTRLLERVIARVHELPESTRDMLVLRYKEGFTFQKIAAVRGENPKTLQARLSRVLRQLHDEIVAAGRDHPGSSTPGRSTPVPGPGPGSGAPSRSTAVPGP